MDKPPAGHPQQLQIQIDPQESEGIYSNFVLLAHSPSEFFLDFARILPGVPRAKVYSRIIMTPQTAALPAQGARGEESRPTRTSSARSGSEGDPPPPGISASRPASLIPFPAVPRSDSPRRTAVPPGAQLPGGGMRPDPPVRPGPVRSPEPDPQAGPPRRPGPGPRPQGLGTQHRPTATSPRPTDVGGGPPRPSPGAGLLPVARDPGASPGALAATTPGTGSSSRPNEIIVTTGRQRGDPLLLRRPGRPGRRGADPGAPLRQLPRLREHARA